MRTRLIVITGIVGWVGGLATMVGVSSCDVEEDALAETAISDPPAMAVVDPADELTSKPRVMDPGDWKDVPEDIRQQVDCDMMARPSALVSIVKEFDDYYQPVKPDHVWFEHDGQIRDAMCLPDGVGGCSGWIPGYELEGEMTVSAEYCGTVVDVTFEVAKTGCHVDTRYVFLPVSTRGCLATPSDPAEPPDPPGPEHEGSL